MVSQHMAAVLAPDRSPSSYPKKYVKQSSATRPRTNLYPPDSESSSSVSSDSEYNISDSESPELVGESSLPLQGTFQISAHPKREITSQATPHAPTDKPYICSHVGCGKRYRKPSRLQEHEISHTGERPFVCSECGQTYLRDSHLRAHSRSHLPASARPFVCTHETVVLDLQRPGNELISTQRTPQRDSTITTRPQACGQKFWTAQHLRAHELAVHHGEKPYKCTLCPLAFKKHGALRLHIAEIHSPPGTKPYRCEHPGCTQSFATNQKLKTHARVHDVTRYACAHPDCSNNDINSVQFPTWSLLQDHMHSQHPPKCPYPVCNGRTFTSSKGLRGHIKTHRDRELEASYTAGSPEISSKRNYTEVDTVNEPSGPPLKRRRGGEVGRDWACTMEACDKSFKSVCSKQTRPTIIYLGKSDILQKKAMQDHVRVSHEGLRKFSCPKDGCNKTFGYKHVMQRHLERHHRPRDDSTSPPPGPINQKKITEMEEIIGLITGQDYDGPPQTSEMKMMRPRVIVCPWPDAFEATEPSSNTHTFSAVETRVKCAFKFSRAYDLRRHLRSAHGLEVDADEVGTWVLENKRSNSNAVV